MRTIERTNQFKRDYKRETKGRSGAYAQKLDTELGEVVQVLSADGTLEPRYVDHPLTGEWRDHRDCHVRCPYRKSYPLAYPTESGDARAR